MMMANDLLNIVDTTANERAMEGFCKLMAHVCNLYTCGESSSLSEFEAYGLAESVLYVLGYNNDPEQQTIELFSSDDIVGIWSRKRSELESRISDVMQLWKYVVTVMPPIRNIALRDTLANIGKLPSAYDTFFDAHEIPVSIDYPLSKAVPESLKGLDYVESWLTQLLSEAVFLAQFDVDDMVSYLDSWCPDYRGLHINLYEPIYEAWCAGVIQPVQMYPS